MPAIFILSGLFLMARPVYHLARQAWLQQIASQKWAQRQTAGPLKSGEPAAWLKAEKAELNTLLTYDASPENLMDYPCISNRGAEPGQTGTLIIQGHRDSHFANLGKLDLGDMLSLEHRDGGLERFRVQDREILSANALETRFPDTQSFNGLALVTCYPFKHIGPAPQRYIVWLKRVENENRSGPSS